MYNMQKKKKDIEMSTLTDGPTTRNLRGRI